MKKLKSALCLVLAICMVATLFTGLCTVSAAVDITLDDKDAVLVPTGATSFEVKIPDGRPRVPQIDEKYCLAGDKVTQAFLPDDAVSADATLVRDGVTYTITFVKDPSLGFVLQYDDHYVFKPGFTGATFSSNDTSVASVNASTGEITVKKVSDSPVTITATGGGQTEKLVITKTIRAVLGIWMLTGQSNAAINYSDYSQVKLIPQKGTSYFFGGNSTNSHVGCRIISPMTQDSGVANFGNLEPAMGKALYEKLGEKNLILNTAISGTGIGKFLPGNTAADSENTWKLINTLYEQAYAEWTAPAFQANYETRIRSYFFLQGCAEVNSYWETHYNGFAVNKNGNAFTTCGNKYAAGSHTFRTYMTEVLGFDYCLDIMVSWRPVGITASTRTAQFHLAEDFDDYYVISRVNQTFSKAEGTYRYDNLHYTQAGRDIVGSNAGGNAAALYAGKVLETATKATAYFNKIGYDNGDTIYVKAGDFYNYCTRPYPYSADNNFVYKFVGGDKIVSFDGQNDFVIKKNAPAGASCTMQIFNPGEKTPVTEITLQVVGEADTSFKTRSVETYSWDFTSGEAVTTAGDIDLTKASDTNSDFAGKSTMELSQDLWLDSDGYWSIEWKSSNMKTYSMLGSSANAYAGSVAPNFMFFYYTTDGNVGWKTYRDSAYTDSFWRTSAVDFNFDGEHTYKLECRNNVYTFSIDGAMSDSREIIEGHGSYSDSSSYSPQGYFDNNFNLHYLLGGINQNGLSSTKYGYNGDVSYVTINIGEENPAITNVMGFPYEAASGKGTAKDPYVINAGVKAGTGVAPSDFTANVPTGTMALSTEKFGGAKFKGVSCNSGTTTVYAMMLGALPYQSTFYKVNFTVGSGDSFPDNMYPTDDVFVVDQKNSGKLGSVAKYTVEGKEYNFVKGYNVFSDIGEAVKLLPSGGKLYLVPGTYSTAVTFKKPISVYGAKAGIDPNKAGATKTDMPTANPDRGTDESTLTAKWSIANGCTKLVLDGLTVTGNGGITDTRTASNTEGLFALRNLIVTALTSNNAFSFGETKNAQSGAIKGMLMVSDMRATNLTRQAFNTALTDTMFISCVFSDITTSIDTPRLAGVTVKDPEGEYGTYGLANCYINNVTTANVFKFNYLSVYSPSVAKYDEFDIILTNNVIKDSLSNSDTATNGIFHILCDTTNLYVEATENTVLVSGNTGTAKKSFISAIGNSAATNTVDFSDCFVMNKNKFITSGTELPKVFSSDANGTKNFNGIRIGGVYSEIGGVVVAPYTDTTKNYNTNGNPISLYEYYYTKADFSENTCTHTRTSAQHKAATCAEEGYDDVTCDICGKAVSHTVLPKSDHIPATKWTEVKAPTCTEAGREAILCVVCKNELETRALKALGHDDGVWKDTAEPTCTKYGERKKFCTRCQAVLATEQIAKRPHEFKETDSKKANCTEAGYVDYKCENCDETKHEVISPLLHTPGQWETVKTASCYEPGEKVIRCTVCHEVLLSEPIAPQHKGKWVVVTEPGVGRTGLKQFICEECTTVLDSETIPAVESSVAAKFIDVGTTDWYVKNGALDYVYDNKLFAGTSKTEFSPNAPMTRAMFVTVLGRLYGAKVSKNAKTPFTDVKSGQWYTGYVKWAYENGIVAGFSSTTFGPDVSISREQICKMMVEYCNAVGIKLQKKNAVEIFVDSAKISSWAKPYVKACQQADLVHGKAGNIFDPKGEATRAEVATILLNFHNNYYKN